MTDRANEPGLGAGLAGLLLFALTVALYFAALYYTLVAYDWRRALLAFGLTVAGGVAFKLFTDAWRSGKER